MKSNRVRFLLILSILLTMVSAVITYLNVQQKKETIALVIHHYQVIQSSTRLLSLMKDMELGHRGYLITKDTTFLQPYHSALNEIDEDIDTITLLVKDHPRQLEIFQKHLVPLVQFKKTRFEQSFLILKQFGLDSATHFDAMRVSKVSLDSIRFWMTDFIEFEQAQLLERNESLEQRYFLNDVIRFSSFTLIGLTSLAALITISEKEKDNLRLLNELQKFNLQLEQKVKDRTSELESANRNLVRLNEEKNNFLGITTHDLKAPLAGISSLLELMKLERESLTPQHLEYIQLMEETCENMQRLISDLLDLSRIEQGSIGISRTEVSLSKMFTQLEENFRQWAMRKNVRLAFTNHFGADKIYSDQDVLLRILNNLISNALKFSTRDKNVNVSVKNESGFIRFDVKDEGPGIRQEERPRLFLKFQKLSARPTGGEISTGLGLSIVKDLVDLLKGTIEAQSEFGKGACFTVKLPQNG